MSEQAPQSEPQNEPSAEEHAKKQEELDSTLNAKPQGEQINPEALGTKPQGDAPRTEHKDTNTADQKGTPDPKTEAKGEEGKGQAEAGAKKAKEGIIDLIMGIPKAIWNKGVIPFYELGKSVVTRIWGWCTSNYKAEVQLYKDIGPAKYFLDRGSKVLIKVLKVVAIVTVAGLINSLLVNMTGISLFDPMTLAFVAVAALILLIAKSYKDQKAVSDEKFSFTAMGYHIVEGVANA